MDRSLERDAEVPRPATFASGRRYQEHRSNLERALAKSHLPVRHLIRQLEQQGRPVRLAVPDWLITLIDDVAQLFEPYRGVARAGYECVQIGKDWEISLYLGSNETVGGAEDGRRAPINFRFDLKGLVGQFDAVHSYVWNALPECGDFFEDESMVSFVTLEGEKRGTTIRLQIHATSPMESGPGLRKLPDGQVALT